MIVYEGMDVHEWAAWINISLADWIVVYVYLRWCCKKPESCPRPDRWGSRHWPSPGSRGAGTVAGRSDWCCSAPWWLSCRSSGVRGQCCSGLEGGRVGSVFIGVLRFLVRCITIWSDVKDLVALGAVLLPEVDTHFGGLCSVLGKFAKWR